MFSRLSSKQIALGSDKSNNEIPLWGLGLERTIWCTHRAALLLPSPLGVPGAARYCWGHFRRGQWEWTQGKEDESGWGGGWSPGCPAFTGRLSSRKQVCDLQLVLEF